MSSPLLPTDEQQIALASLRTAWSEIGLPHAEAEEAITKLADELRSVLSRTVEGEQARKAQLTADEASLRGELSALSAALAEPASPGTSSSEPPLLRYRAVISEVERLRALRDERAAQRSAAASSLHAILLELSTGTQEEEQTRSTAADADEPAPEGAGGLTVELVHRLRQRLEAAEAERAARLERLAALRAAADAITEQLGTKEEAGCEGAEGDGASYRALSALEARLDHLREEKKRRLHVLSQCTEYIAELRHKLKIPEEQHPDLPSPEKDLSQQVLVTYHTEIERLEALKSERISELIPETRSRVAALAAELHVSAAELAAAVSSDGGDEEQQLYDLEAEERRLRERQATTVKIFALLSKREGVLQQRAEMRASANDPNRLLAKGAGVARRLLQEERLRTTIEKDLPRMNKRLREMTAAWEEEHAGERLLYDGATIVSMLAAQEEDDARIEKEEKARKEAEWAAKKAAREEAKGLQAKGIRPGARYSNGPRKGTAPARKSAAPDGALTPREQHAVNSPRKGPPAKFPPNAFVTPAPTAKENHA